jgi:hypothetical protein
MDSSAVPRKCIKLSEFPIKDSKTRRLFILADGKRSSSAIFKLSAIDEQTGMKLLQCLLEEGYLRVVETFAGKTPKAGQQLVKSSHFIEGLTQELANYVGPFAQVVMNAIDFTDKEICREDRRKIINVVLQEIESEEGRRNFLTAARSIGGD